MNNFARQALLAALEVAFGFALEPGGLRDRPPADDMALGLAEDRFERIEPGTARRQRHQQQPHPPVALGDLIVAVVPASQGFGRMPGGIVPNEHQRTRLPAAWASKASNCWRTYV
jgi:hypothetical protein